jgi:hypothetical protein
MPLPQVRARDRAAGRLDLPDLPVEDLLPLPVQLPPDVRVEVGGVYVEPDVDHVQLRAALDARSRAARVARVAHSEPSVASKILAGNPSALRSPRPITPPPS